MKNGSNNKITGSKTNQYGDFSNGESLHTNAREIEVLLGIYVKISTLKFPRIQIYWSSQSGTRIPAIAVAMPVNRFFKL